MIEEKEALCSLHNTLEGEELMWRQKSRVTWLQVGDRNTQLFKLTTFKHGAMNKILKIKNKQGLIVND